jgi:hypothetical protein
VLGGSGANRTVSVTPAADAYGGPATITLSVFDGVTTTQTSFAVSIAGVADTPAVTGASTNEDTQNTAGLVISRNPADGAEVTYFKITGISGGTLYQTNGTTLINEGDFITFAHGNAGLKFTPSSDSTVSGSFDVQASTAANDTGLGGGVTTATIAVAAVNDAPNVSALGDQTALEDAGAQTLPNFATAVPGGGPDEAGQAFAYAVSNDNSALFSVQPSLDAAGNLTYTTATNAFGVATVTVVVVDSGGTANGGIDTSLSQSFTITVSPVNDDPVIAVNAGAAISSGSDLTLGGTLLWVTDPDNAPTQILYTITAVPTSGTLYLSGAQIGVNDTFTQDDIDNTRVSYVHGGVSSGPDAFTFSVVDGAGGAIAPAGFGIAVGAAPPASPPPPAPSPVLIDPGLGVGTSPPTSSDPSDPPSDDAGAAPSSSGEGSSKSGTEKAELQATPEVAGPGGGVPAAATEGDPKLILAGPQASGERPVLRRALLGASEASARNAGAGSEGGAQAATGTAELASFLAPAIKLADTAALNTFKASLNNAGWVDALNEMRDQVDGQIKVEQMLVASSVAVGGSLSVGYVVWLLRGGLLLSSLLSSLPAWQSIQVVVEGHKGAQHNEADHLHAWLAQRAEPA